MITAGIPTIFVDAQAIGYTGAELQDAINNDPKALAMFESIRGQGALRMGLVESLADAENRQHTPKIAFVSKPSEYVSASGKRVAVEDVDILVRAMSMGKLHHAMPGTVAVAIGAASAIPNTIVSAAAGDKSCTSVRFGHPSGTLQVGAEAAQKNGKWVVEKAIMSRSARVLMEGQIRVPGDFYKEG
jgi:2-methylaconitate cis-trans-isomerase PrpF